jgi:CBS domain-containing protein
MLNYGKITAADACKTPITLSPSNTLLDARNLMMKYNISRMLVAVSGKAIGIITEKDIARYVYSEKPARRPSEIKLEQAMSRNLITVIKQTDLQSCSKLMIDAGISSLVVTDNDMLYGILTKTDIVDAYARFCVGRNLVSNYMTSDVVFVAPDEPIHIILQAMSERNISRVVVAKDWMPVGMITSRDMLPVCGLVGGGFEKYTKKSFVPPGIKAIFLAHDIMKYDPITIRTDSDLADAAQVMTKNGISGLPVVDESGKLQGIITKTDIVRAVSQMK